MKKLFQKSSFMVFMTVLMCSLLGVVDAGAMCANAVTLPEGGVANQGEANTYQNLDENVPQIVLDYVDQEVVKIRPHLFPAGTIAAAAKVKQKNINDPVYRYYSVSAIPLKATLATAYTHPTNGDVQIDLDFGANNELIAINETLIAPALLDTSNKMYVLEVVDKDSARKPIVRAIYGANYGTGVNVIPDIPVGTVFVRGARSGTEKQINTDAFNISPIETEQYLQKFLMKTEESTLWEMMDKEVRWNKSDVTDQAIYEFRQTQYTDFLFGALKKTNMPNKYNDNKQEQAFFMQGIWWQAGKDYSFGSLPPTKNTLVSMMKAIFVGNASSSTKILLAGSDLVEALQKIDYDQVVSPGKREQAHGIEFTSIISIFGKLLIVHDQGFNEFADAAASVNFARKGLVIDPAYFVKPTLGWRSYNIDNRQQGTSDTTTQIFIEQCALVLKNPKAHTRISLD